MQQLVRFAVDKLGGIGATVGAALGWWYWTENATWNCSGLGQDFSCGSGGPLTLEIAGVPWGREEFTGMTMFIGAILWLGGAAIYRVYMASQPAGPSNI